jgi:hypothetical protein
LGIHKHAMLDLEQFEICQTLFLPEELHAWRHLLDRHRPAEQLRIHLSWLLSQRESIKHHQTLQQLHCLTTVWDIVVLAMCHTWGPWHKHRACLQTVKSVFFALSHHICKHVQVQIAPASSHQSSIKKNLL